MKAVQLITAAGCALAAFACAFAAAAQGPVMHPPVIVEHRAYVPGRFRLEIDGVRGSFSEIQGMETVVEAVEYRNGAEDAHARKITGLRKYSSLTLKRGVTNDTSLWQWWHSVSQGRSDPRAVHITEIGGPRRYNLFDCFPSSYSGPSLDARSHRPSPGFEQITFRCNRAELMKG
jgi:phage tail-like protein